AVHLRTIGRMGVVPGVFNINEPILFGAPIIMNPLFFLPFVLVLMAMRSRSRQLKSVAKIGLLPSLFNINEPILFGFPVIMNP
ncbi:PTS transporter subunit EIIC, partial [Klebsiella pneumoniae]|uniref:PTS transporter subunit EIIC n=1 Tax=Klebsiella pneumoniae TaxID=573 RepID=UPI00214B38BE